MNYFMDGGDSLYSTIAKKASDVSAAGVTKTLHAPTNSSLRETDVLGDRPVRTATIALK
jgi:hypothetical protein